VSGIRQLVDPDSSGRHLADSVAWLVADYRGLVVQAWRRDGQGW